MTTPVITKLWLKHKWR